MKTPPNVYLVFLLFFFTSLAIKAQNVGINTTNPDQSAALEISSNTAGILIPRLTEAQRDAIPNPATGLLIFQTNASPGFYFYTGSAWTGFGGQGWDVNGQAGTDSTVNFIGTTDNQGFSIGVNNTEALRASPTGNLGIGEANPTAKLHLSGTAPLLRYQDGNEANNAFLTSDNFGNASWNQFVDPNDNSDEDWLFQFGSDTGDPVYHEGGGVVIGRTGTTIRNLDIDNGQNEGSTFGIGDIEFIRDGNNETQFSHALTPRPAGNGSTPVDLGINAGGTTLLWTEIYTINPETVTSDGSLKKDISPLDYSTEQLMNLRPVSFLWKEEKRNNLSIPSPEKEVKLGFIAQEVQQVIPEIVKGKALAPGDASESSASKIVNSEYLGITYSEFIPLLVKVKQEQHKRIQALLEENKELIEELKKK